MIDYRAIAALSAVIETQSFDAAADKLHVTQSAISQRIKSLENYHGMPVLLRTQPYQPTEFGAHLLGHYQQVSLLEAELEAEISHEHISGNLSVAISRDCLETWFSEVITKLQQLMPVNLNIIADDQEVTLDYLRKGLVASCASTCNKPIASCKADFLGYFDYVMVASPEFQDRYFKKNGSIKQRLLEAPAAIFDRKDHLHQQYLSRFFKISMRLDNYHTIPSVEGFKQFALNSYAYALIPRINISKELESGKLVNLFPNKVWDMPVYWHSWAIETALYKKFNWLIKQVATKLLRN